MCQSLKPFCCAQFYRLNNASWLQPRCEYHQNLYTKMQPHMRAVVVPGAFGSTSGPRGGALRWNVTSDPFSCSNLGGLLTDFNGGHSGAGPGHEEELLNLTAHPELSGMEYEIDQVLTHVGGRECWNLSQYDDFVSVTLSLLLRSPRR